MVMCVGCGKTVTEFTPEYKHAEGSHWHTVCFQHHQDEAVQAKKRAMDQASYEKVADVRPAYYRAADVDMGAPARLEQAGHVVAAVDPISQYPVHEDLHCRKCHNMVGAAELRHAEGHVYHENCWQHEFSERQARHKQEHDKHNYEKHADVCPAYYRAADVDTGMPARMESCCAHHTPHVVGVVEGIARFGDHGEDLNCHQCHKKVGAAELRHAEGSTWHNQCYEHMFRERQAEKKAEFNAVNYEKDADVSPAYYRTSDPAEKLPARMEACCGHHNCN